jgi:hypothetical protein
VIEVYEVVVNALVTNTFRVVADTESEASRLAAIMFSNDIPAKVLDLKFDVYNGQEPGARSQEPGARSQEPGARSQ